MVAASKLPVKIGASADEAFGNNVRKAIPADDDSGAIHLPTPRQIFRELEVHVSASMTTTVA